MKTSDAHSAASSMAGFIFQLDRALFWLASAEIGAAVGIESLDDVVAISANGDAVLEQDKLSWVRNPMTDRSENLWKTLAIWLGLITDGERDLSTTQFHLISTYQINTGIAALLKESPSERNSVKIIETLREVAATPNEEWAKYSAIVTSHSDERLGLFLDRVTVIDEIPSTDLDGASKRLASQLSIPSEIVEEVIAGLRGWIQSRVMAHFRLCALKQQSPQAAWIESASFRQEFAKLISRHFQDKPIIRAASQILISKQQKEEQRHATFVRQLEILDMGADEQERVLEAIEDYLKGVDERSRLALQNGVTGQAFESYTTSLIDHWKATKRSALRQPLATEPLTGQEILDRTMVYQAHLDGMPVTESYLTRGTYHKLADDSALPIGWHPKFKELLNDTNNSDQ